MGILKHKHHPMVLSVSKHIFTYFVKLLMQNTKGFSNEGHTSFCVFLIYSHREVRGTESFKPICSFYPFNNLNTFSMTFKVIFEFTVGPLSVLESIA